MSIKIKELYTFTIPKSVKIIDKEESINEDGSKVTTEKEVNVEKNFIFCVRKPNARLINEAQLFYNVQIGRGLQEGLISAALLHKRLKNDGGSLSEKDKDTYVEKLISYTTKQKEYQDLLTVIDKSDEQQAALDKLIGEIKSIEKELQELNSEESSMYNCTAESWARTKTLLWWLLNLLYQKDENGEYKVVFAGENFKDKYNTYCEMDDDETITPEDLIFIKKAIEKAQIAIVIWYYNGANSQIEIDEQINKMAN